VIPLTGPAHLSLFTSRYPQEHGARRNGSAMASDRTLVALPQILRAHGYNNAGFVSGWPLNGRLTKIDDWFDHYDEDLTRTYQLFNSSRWAEDVTPPAIRWLYENGRGSKPFFLWVHYFDPHSPYRLHSRFARLPRNGSAPPVHVADPEMRERIRNYDSEIAYMDSHIGTLLGAIDRLRLSESTLVVFTADHGESLGEHGYVGHGRHLYQSIIRVPLIFRQPKSVRAAQAIRTPVSILDIAPTVVDLTVRKALEESKAPLTFVGRTLAPAISAAEKLTVRRIYQATFPGKKGFAPQWLSWLWVREQELPLRFGYVEGASKIIWSPQDERVVTYDLSGDPHETRARELHTGTLLYRTETERLKAWFSRTESRAAEQAASARDIEVLKSLGYIQ
jgi:arylsulfatase A-like enzyme